MSDTRWYVKVKMSDALTDLYYAGISEDGLSFVSDRFSAYPWSFRDLATIALQNIRRSTGFSVVLVRVGK
jgi:hypothetical protein